MEIASSLRGRIKLGEFEENRLPSERDLTAEFGVQRATVRRALKELEREGLVFRDTTRRGTFIRSEATPVAANGNGNYGSGGYPERSGIALVIGRAHDTTAPADIARGLSQVANTQGRSMIWFDLPTNSGHAEANVPDPGELMERGIAATVLWPGVPANVERLRTLRAAMPLVLLDRRVPGFESDFVGIDDFQGGQRVTEHLIEIGHHRIGFLSVASHASTVQARCRGWATALRNAGIEPRTEWILHRDHSGGEITPADDDALELLLSGGDAPGAAPLTAVVCTNDTVAAGLIRHLNDTGRRIGEDVAVTGFGNTFPPLLEAVGLTTVAQPFEEMGRSAATILLSRLQGEGAELPFPRELELPVDLVVRRSCGAASSGRARR